MLSLIGDICANRRFHVADGFSTSRQRRQRSGISQGCPLSPFLFIMVMTVALNDAVDNLGSGAKADMDAGYMSALLYAGDTLLVGRSQEHLQQLLDAVFMAGGRAGMDLHWDKFQLMQIGCE
eukprot:5560464-Pyramimonas_sp.AAC.1